MAERPGEALGADPSATVQATAQRVLTRVAQEADDALLTTPVGGIRLIDYLPSRVLELTVHTADIAAAVKLDTQAPSSAASVSLHLMADLAIQHGCAVPLLLSMTGRGSLAPGFNVLTMKIDPYSAPKVSFRRMPESGDPGSKPAPYLIRGPGQALWPGKPLDSGSSPE